MMEYCAAGKRTFSPTRRDELGRFAPSVRPFERQLPRLCTDSKFNAIVCIDTLAFTFDICNHVLDGAKNPTTNPFHPDLGCTSGVPGAREKCALKQPRRRRIHI